MSTLILDRISVAYGGRTVVRDLSLAARAGELLGLIGPNGAGKTSLVRAISGVLRPCSGSITFDGRDLIRMSAAERARHLAVVPQAAPAPDGFTVAELVLMGRSPHLPRFGGEGERDRALARQAMVKTATWHLRDFGLGALSGGEQQRVLMARALAQEPRVLLLDEATAHLDLKHQIAMFDLARQLAAGGLTVIAVLHDLNLAALYAQRLALLAHGQLLVCDTPERVLTAGWLRQAYGVDVLVGAHPHYPIPQLSLLRQAEP